MQKLMFVTAAFAYGVLWGASSVSSVTKIWLDTSSSLIWKTITADSVEVSVDWPENAVRAVLSVKTGGREVVRSELADRSVRVCKVELPLPAAEGDEGVLDFLLEFQDVNANVLPDMSRRASVGLVRGICGRSFRLVPDGPDAGSWRKTQGTTVAPVYADTESVTVDGAHLALNGTPGWVMLPSMDSSAHDVRLNRMSGGPLSASLYGFCGLIIRIR